MALTISNAVMKKIEQSISFPDENSRSQFIADAVNSYIALGHLVENGDALYAGPTSTDLRRVRLPFETAEA